MLNNKGERELAYITKITDITPIEGADRVELAHINGWHVMVKKGEFKIGDLCVYFEIDSKLPETVEFEFMSRYNFRVKTQRYFKGKVISQGLIMTLKELNLEDCKEGDFVTERLKITYYEPEDNTRKASNKKLAELKADKFMERWARKHKFLSKFKFICSIKRKIFLNIYFKNQIKKKTSWPYWVVKTDEERCQNLPKLFKDNDKHYIATEKIDGTSTTFTMLQAPKSKRKAIVCSRNVVFDTPEKEEKNFYKDTDGNVYLEMFEKYRIEEVLNKVLSDHPEYTFITIQGETYGGTIQKRNYGPEHKLAIFNIIFQIGSKAPERLNPIQMRDFIYSINRVLNTGLECVPIVDEDFILPSSCEELLKIAEGKSLIDSQPREGLVFRDKEGKESFKAVSNTFLEKYHN